MLPKNSLKFSLGVIGLLAISVGVVVTRTVSGNAFQNEESALRDVLLRSASSFAKNDIAEATKVWANDESLNDLRERPRELWLG